MNHLNLKFNLKIKIMKKLILLSAIFSLFASKLLAQEPTASAVSNTETAIQESSNSTKPEKERREERYENASPEQKEKMDKRREENKKLSKEEKQKKREENRSGNKDKKDSSDTAENYNGQPYARGEGRGMGGNGRYQNASPEQKEKMDKHREMMRSLAPEKRELVKKEMERHRAEIKKITGFDLPSPGNQNGPLDKPE